MAYLDNVQNKIIEIEYQKKNFVPKNTNRMTKLTCSKFLSFLADQLIHPVRPREVSDHLKVFHLS